MDSGLTAPGMLAAFQAAAPLFDDMGIGLWYLNFDTSAVWQSLVTRKLHERDTPPDGLEPALGHYSADDQAVLTANIRRAQETGQGWDLIMPFRTGQGRQLQVRTYASAVRHDGRVIGLAGTIEDVTERIRDARDRERFAMVVDQMATAALIADRHRNTVWVNNAFEQLTGYGAGEVTGRRILSVLMGPDRDPDILAKMIAATGRSQHVEGEMPAYRADGSEFWLHYSISPIVDEHRQITGFMALMDDVTARRTAEASAAAEIAARRKAELLLTDIIDSLPAYLHAFDADNRLALVNQTTRNRWPDYASQIQPGMEIHDVVRAFLEHEGRPPADIAIDEAYVAQRTALVTSGLIGNERQLADGSWLFSSSRRSDTGTLVWVRSDITALKEAQLRANDLALRDPLTGLFNRSGFLGALSRRQAGAKAAVASMACLLLLDVDHFKAMNDAYGHDAGDRLLEIIGRRIKRVLTDGEFAARLGGDEFAVLLKVENETDARRRIDKLLKSCTRSAMLWGLKIVPSVSLGATCARLVPEDLTLWLREADRALYQAKRTGRSRAVFYSERLAEELAAQHLLAQDLRRALAKNEVEIMLQPQVSIATGATIAFEALARWSRNGEWVPPQVFVAAAEEHGLAEKLGFYILKQALEACRALRVASGKHVCVAVNVSNIQLLAEDFTEQVLDAVNSAKLPPDALELEITETVFLERSWERITARLARLRAKGVRIALDDFGTGHASLRHLSMPWIDVIKIDQSFVAAIGKDARGEMLARTLAGLAISFGLQSVAEGVETTEQYEALAAMGCHCVQGHLIAAPMRLAACLDVVGQPIAGSAPTNEL